VQNIGKILKKKSIKLLVVNNQTAQEIEDLSKTMKTTPLDVINAGLELLKQSLNRDIILRQPNTGLEKKISTLRDVTNHD
jgi:hypothetical protein